MLETYFVKPQTIDRIPGLVDRPGGRTLCRLAGRAGL